MMDTLPEKFENVEVSTKSNVYFDGKVVSHALRCADGTRKTVGVIFAGTYHFGTGAPERMEITTGKCRVKLDGSEVWMDYATSACFDIPGNSGFDIAVEAGHTDYICTFLE